MSEESRKNISKQIQDAVQEALNTGDFRNLNETVSRTVNDAVREAKQQWQQTGARMQTGQSGQNRADRPTGADRRTATDRQSETDRQLPEIKTKKVGNVASILYMTFGGIGIGMGSLLLLIVLAIWGLGAWGTGHGIAVVLLAGSIGMVKVGMSKRNRLKRAERYVQLSGKDTYVDIEELASHTGKRKGTVLRDVRQMIRLGIYPEGHLDDQNSCLMLTDATYREYLALQKQRKNLEIEAKEASLRRKTAVKEEDNAGKEATADNAVAYEELIPAKDIEDPQLAAMVKEGQKYIKRIREANDEIEGEIFSEKLYGLEKLLQEIFLRLKEHPEQMPKMQKFMKYYLPTTLKLIESYAEFDRVSVPGEEILSAKKEIEKALDTIIQAFAELLNKMFQADVYDVTTDAQVLQTMLAKDGLTRDELTKDELTKDEQIQKPVAN